MYGIQLILQLVPTPFQSIALLSKLSFGTKQIYSKKKIEQRARTTLILLNNLHQKYVIEKKFWYKQKKYKLKSMSFSLSQGLQAS